MTFKWRREWVALLAIVVATVATLVLYPRLPDPMPTHWNAAGEVDGYSSRLVGAWLMPGIMVLLYALLLALPRMDPRRENIKRFEETYALVRGGTVLFMGLIHLAILYVVITGRDVLVGTFVPIGVGILFLIIGNYMPRMRPNWFMGIRTPWTLSSDHVWRATHRLGGRLFVLMGLLMLLMPLIPSGWMVFILLPMVFGSTALMFGYSYWLYRQEEQASTPSAKGSG